MNVTLTTKNPLEIETGCLIVGIGSEGRLSPTAAALDKASNGAVKKYIQSGDIHTCVGHSALFHGFPGAKAERVLFVGIGKEKMPRREWIRAVTVGLNAAYVAKKVTLCAIEWLGDSCEDAEYWMVQTATVTALTTFQKPTNFKTKPIPWKEPDEVELVVSSQEEFECAVEIGEACANAMKFAKELGDLPANICTPSFFADHISEFVKATKVSRLSCKVADYEQIAKMGMGCFLGVVQGSHEEPKMVRLEYKGGEKGDKPIVLVGKGLTFDSGGISLKPGANMDEMKYDMSGAGAVVGALIGAAILGLPLNVTALIGLAENMPGGGATKPGDILKAYNGKSVEVLNTDAEGRLVLCDLLAYAADKLNPEVLIDVCTLTGACAVALGNNISGLFSNDDDLADDLLFSGKWTNDPAWRLPLDPEFTKQLDSNFADLANIGNTRYGGACTAAAFLESFVGDCKWAHLDIAGTAWKSGKEKGSTGRPVPLLLDYLIDRVDFGLDIEGEE